MCISLHPADFENTKLYAGEARREDGTYVHVLAYQNRASSEGPNAMILPLPAGGTIGPANAVDTRSFKRFLDDIHEATHIRSHDHLGRAFDDDSQIFDVGSYTVVLADRPDATSRALDQVPANKRPALNPAVLDAFGQLYPGWPLAVCCWDGHVDAEPLLWWYEPKDPEWLFAPALDAHDGGPPNLNAEVGVDHYVAFGSTIHPTPMPISTIRAGDPALDKLMAENEQMGRVRYQDEIPGHIRALLPAAVTGTAMLGDDIPNGDFWCSTKQLVGPALRFAPGEGTKKIRVRLGGWGK